MVSFKRFRHITLLEVAGMTKKCSNVIFIYLLWSSGTWPLFVFSGWYESETEGWIIHRWSVQNNASRWSCHFRNNNAKENVLFDCWFDSRNGRLVTGITGMRIVLKTFESRTKCGSIFLNSIFYYRMFKDGTLLKCCWVKKITNLLCKVGWSKFEMDIRKNVGVFWSEKFSCISNRRRRV